jgi:hypothetical protein
MREARGAVVVGRTNIGTIDEAGEADGIVFIATELMKRGNLCARMRGRPSPIGEVRCDAAGRACSALARVWEDGERRLDLRDDGEGHRKGRDNPISTGGSIST